MTTLLGQSLSDREMQLLTLIADGLSNIDIGDRLNLSPLTIKSHLARMGRKLGTGDRAGMVGVGFRQGWLR